GTFAATADTADTEQKSRVLHEIESKAAVRDSSERGSQLATGSFVLSRILRSSEKIHRSAALQGCPAALMQA
ncbi:MAG: hypothetical protein DMF97_13325, partial [Acidobacteria bacterium]